MAPADLNPMSPRPSRSFFWIQLTAYVAAMALVLPFEWLRWNSLPPQARGAIGWLAGINIDTSLYFLWLLVAPLLWLVRTEPPQMQITGKKSSARESSWWPGRFTPGTMTRRSWGIALGIGILALIVSRSVAAAFGDLPPAYHDEYSYLFQAKTFLAGRLWFPSHEWPRLFDQMHVLNEGRFASRYFPGTGAWLAPFVALGHPHWGEALAAAGASMLIFAAGRQLGGDRLGLLAGGLTALSPGMALFSNLLLAHQPTMLGLSLFLFGFFRWMNRDRLVDAALASVGLAFAMLCRPMTAAGFAFPFGLLFLWRVILLPEEVAASRNLRRLKLLLAMGGPLLAGLLLMWFYNRAITGDGGTTPYQLYTDIYTPRHVYGFDNVTRGEQQLGDRQLPLVTRNYDQWAENLTPRLAMRNVGVRLLASFQWTLGVIPLLMAGIIASPSLLAAVRRRRPAKAAASEDTIPSDQRDLMTALLFAGIVSLHFAHVPYWYDGIMHWHYVFESGPLWLLLFAVATARLFVGWERTGHILMPAWWSGLIVIALLMSYFSFEPFWGARMDAAISEIAFSRAKYAQFQERIERLVRQRPALVLIEPDPADRHIDFVTNPPDLAAEVLFGRFDRESMKLEDIARHFSDRQLYLYRAADQMLWEIAAPQAPRDPAL